MNMNPESLPLTRRAFYLRSGRFRFGVAGLTMLLMLWGGSMVRGLVANFPVANCFMFIQVSGGSIGAAVDSSNGGMSLSSLGAGVGIGPVGSPSLTWFPAARCGLDEGEIEVVLPYWLLTPVAAAIALAFTERQFRGYRTQLHALSGVHGNTGELRA